jgi:predicted dehydrogenase
LRAPLHDWRALVADPRVEAIIIASPQETHRAIAEAAFAGKPVFCEKPLGASLADAQAMVAAAEAPANAQYDRLQLCPHARHAVRAPALADGAIGQSHGFAANIQRIFWPTPTPRNWRCEGRANGCMGDLAPHMINCALALMGDIAEISARIETLHPTRPGPDGPLMVENDDHAQMMVRFASGVMGHLYFSRTATGRKMGYAYEIHGTKGAIRFDQEDQNAVLAVPGRRAGGHARFHQDPDRSRASRLPALLSGAGAWHRLSGPDHH